MVAATLQVAAGVLVGTWRCESHDMWDLMALLAVAADKHMLVAAAAAADPFLLVAVVAAACYHAIL